VPGDFRGGDEYGELPIHTGAVFTGDFLFVSGIGQLWEGDERQFLIGADKFRRLPPQTAVFVGHEYTETLAPWAAWLEPDNDACQDKLDWVLRQRYGGYDPMPTIPSTVDFEMRTNPYLRCNEPVMLQRLGQPLIPFRKEADDEKLAREAGVLAKLLKLKRDSIAYSLLPTGLPRSYRDGVDAARVRIPVLHEAIRKLRFVWDTQKPLRDWMANVGITPRQRPGRNQVQRGTDPLLPYMDV
jgi:hypothetical protein